MKRVTEFRASQSKQKYGKYRASNYEINIVRYSKTFRDNYIHQLHSLSCIQMFRLIQDRNLKKCEGEETMDMERPAGYGF